MILCLGFVKFQRLGLERALSFSVAFTADRITHDSIRQEFLLYPAKIEQLVSDCPDTDAYQLNFDLFPWT